MTYFLIRLFIKDKDNINSPSVRRAYGNLSGISGIICNLLLFAVKLFTGLISGSIAILADGFNNLTDMGSCLVTMFGLRYAGKPADPEHPFGHGRMEYMSGFFISVVIALVGVELCRSSAEKVIEGGKANISGWMFIVLMVSILIKLWMFFFNRKLGKKTGAVVLSATAQDSINDVIATSAVLLSAVIAYFADLHLDGYFGFAIGLFIIYSGIKTAQGTVHQLLGQAPSPEMVAKIRELVMKHDEFLGLHDLLIHSYGPGRCYANLDVEVSAGADLRTIHKTVDQCEREAEERLGIHLVIHIDPVETGDSDTAALLNRIHREILQIDSLLRIHDFQVSQINQRKTLLFDVVIPPGFQNEDETLRSDIREMVRKIDPSYDCIIHLDRNYSLPD